MTLRRRVTLMSALVVGATLVLASVTCYLVMRGELRGQIDDSLREQGAQTARIPPNNGNPADFPRRVPQPQRRTGPGQPPGNPKWKLPQAFRTLVLGLVRQPRLAITNRQQTTSIWLPISTLFLPRRLLVVKTILQTPLPTTTRIWW